LLQLAYGALSTQILCVAAQWGLAEQLARAGAVTAHELGPQLGVDSVVLERILRALVSMNVCAELDANRFQLTSLGEYLRPNHPDTVEPRILFNSEVAYRLWGELSRTVRTGEGASQRVLGMPFYDYLVKEPAAGSLFDRTMASVVRYRHRPAVDAYDFGQFGTVVDVGGGNGALMAEILKVYPGLTGIIFDLPRAATEAQQTIDAAGLRDRCRFIGGDAFENVPEGGDAYVLANFVLAWGDNQAVLPLRNCRKAISPKGKVLLVEWVMPAANEPREGYWFWDTVNIDLNMLAIFGSGGRVRTRSGFQDLLAAAGFVMTAVVPTRTSATVIEARPA
jgi:hypothetical protein